jgi:hypothetical protein
MTVDEVMQQWRSAAARNVGMEQLHAVGWLLLAW